MKRDVYVCVNEVGASMNLSRMSVSVSVSVSMSVSVSVSVCVCVCVCEDELSTKTGYFFLSSKKSSF